MIQIPHSPGSLERHAEFPSQHVPARNVDVWLPPDYPAPGVRYPVIYMHDGQNLFQPETAYGGVDWGVDEALAALIEAGKVPPAILVSPWNTAHRWQEYMPHGPYEASAAIRLGWRLHRRGGPPCSDTYLAFLVEELKPFIDAAYPTRPEAAHTFLMGSSMGGLISLYGLERHPEVFGGVGCLSTHWPAGNRPLVDWLGTHLPPPGSHRLYFDFGTTTLDRAYEPFQKRMDGHLRRAGYTPERDWQTRKFPGAAHNEAAWRSRVHLPLEFLLQER
jgi:enterochelin esterase-like enzyme